MTLHPVTVAALTEVRRRALPLAASTVLVVAAFASGMMTPVWMLAVVWVVNVATAIAYRVIPSMLAAENAAGAAPLGVYISPSVTGEFRRFIGSCGTHHEWSHTGMMLMMAGAMLGDHHDVGALTGATGLPPAGVVALWAGFAIMVVVDVRTCWVSFAAAAAFRRSKDAVAGEELLRVRVERLEALIATGTTADEEEA